MVTVTTSKRIDTALLRDELGVADVLTSGELPWDDGEKEVSANVDEATLTRAITEHVPPPAPGEAEHQWRDAVRKSGSWQELRDLIAGDADAPSRAASRRND